MLRACRTGDADAFNLLVPTVYQQLHKLAAAHLRSERSGHTLSATALVHEAYLKLAGANVDWNDRVHFYAIAAGTIRRLLIDHARSHARQKRGGGAAKISLEVAAELSSEPQSHLLEIDEALTELARFDERKAKLVELIYFGGMEVAEAASVSGISVATANRDLRFARAWLHNRLAPEAE